MIHIPNITTLTSMGQHHMIKLINTGKIKKSFLKKCLITDKNKRGWLFRQSVNLTKLWKPESQEKRRKKKKKKGMVRAITEKVRTIIYKGLVYLLRHLILSRLS